VARTRRLAAIMFTDLEGFTSETQRDEAGALRLLREQEKLVGPILAAHRGRKIKSMGDGLLLEFPNALDAVECSVQLQRSVHEHNSRDGARPLRLRVGIHLGDVQRQGTDILGDAVNIASRIEPLAEAGGVCLSAQVFDQVRNKVPYQLVSLGPRSLKGVRESVTVYRIALPWVGGTTHAQRPSLPRLAILPLANISPDPRDEYFADGLTEELTSLCSQIRGLRVIARTSVAQYRSTSKSVAQIGAELGVDSVLEGSVRKAGNRIRVTLQLIDVPTQEHTWSANFNQELDDVFAIQTEVARQTARMLRVELSGADREAIDKKPTSNLDAFQLYLRAIHSLDAMTDATETQAVNETIQCLEEAIRIDPNFSLAHSYLADMVVGGAQAGEYALPSKGNRRARQLLDRALELDPSSSAAHLARANYAHVAERDWSAAEVEYRRALELNPSNAHAHGAFGLLLMRQLHFERSKEEFGLAFELDPFNYPYLAWKSMAHYRLGEVDSAIAIMRKIVDSIATFRWPHVVLGWYLVGAGRSAEARHEAELSVGSLIRWMQFLRAVLFAMTGSTEDAARLRKEWEVESKIMYTPATWMAGLYAMTGLTEPALRILEEDCREGERTLIYDYQWEYFDPIRNEPRFIEMLRGLNLPTDVRWWRPAERDGT
jgi:adenylate cyclase